jgi:restriction endonuclease Mrr
MEQAKGSQFLRFCIPIVKTLKALGGSGQPKEVTDTVLERLHISEREQAQTLKNGSSRVRNQVAWARFYLAKADWLDASRRGVWALTEKGRTVSLSQNGVLQLFKDVHANFPTKNEKPKAADENAETTPLTDPADDYAGKRTLTGAAEPRSKELERQRKLHPALKATFSNLYGYTSDADGIRHALLGEDRVTFDQAKFMLVACSAFTNYVSAMLQR